MDPLSHAAIRELLPRYAAHQLTPSEWATVERHTATCADCRAELGEWLTLGVWLAEDEAAIPLDTGAARGLAAIHARLRQPSESDGFERSALSTMSNQDSSRYLTSQRGTKPSPDLHEWRPSAASPEGEPSRPYQPPQRRVNPLVAGAVALVFLALAASLFYLLAPQGRLRNNIATQPTATGTWSSPVNLPANVSSMAFASSAPQTGYFCSGANPLPSSAPQWLYKTTDGGMTWRALSGGAIPSVSQPVSMRCDIFIDPNDANDVFTQLLFSPREGAPRVVSDTLWRSRDGGSSWSQVSQPQLNYGWINIVLVGSRIVALAAYDQQVPPVCATDSTAPYPHQLDDLYASDNGGATWTKIGQSLTSQGASVVATGVFGPSLTSAGDALFIQTFCVAQQGEQGATSGDQHATWKSTDGGASWSKVTLPRDAYFMGFTRATSGEYVGVAVEQTIGGDSLPTDLPVVYYSADTGATWRALPSLNGMPGLSPVVRNTSVMWVIALPDGAVLAAVNVYDASFAVKSSGVFAIDPHSAKPTWRRFASFNSQTPLDLGGAGQSLALWALTPSNATPVVYLSPLP